MMTIGSILLAIALLILVGLFLARPFLTNAGPRWRNNQASSRRQILLAQKGALLRQIRELDFEHETSKVPDEVYQSQRSQFLTETAAIMQKLDALEDSALPASTGVDSGPDVEADIEAAVANLRRAKATAPAEPASSAAGQKVSRRANGEGGFCPQCGQPVDADDKLCATCGHKLQYKQPA